MKKIFCIVIFLYIFMSVNVFGETKHDYKAAVLIEANTGKILYEYNKDKVLPQASITKLMTYYTFEEFLKHNSINENDFITVEKNKFDIPSDGVKINLKKGDILSIKDLINTMLIISANDSALEAQDIYDKSSGNIVASMNKNCKLLGLTKSHYINVTGITIANGSKKSYNTTTAYETAKLAIDILNKYPQILKTTSQKNYKYKGRIYYNTDTVLYKSKRVDGLKTGHTDEAGYCLVSTEDVTNLPGNMRPTRYIAVVFGCSTEASRTKESLELLKYGEDNFINDKVISKDKRIKIKNDYYENDYINCNVKKDIFILKNNKSKIIENIILNNNLSKNIVSGESIGNITVKSGKETISSKLYAESNIKLKPLYIRIFLSIRDFFKNFLNNVTKFFK